MTTTVNNRLSAIDKRIEDIKDRMNGIHDSLYSNASQPYDVEFEQTAPPCLEYTYSIDAETGEILFSQTGQ